MASSSHTSNASDTATRRTSVSLPASLYRDLERIAKQKKVSLAWVIRDAAENYVEGVCRHLTQKG